MAGESPGHGFYSLPRGIAAAWRRGAVSALGRSGTGFEPPGRVGAAATIGVENCSRNCKQL